MEIDMDAIISVLTGFFVADFFYFLPVPIAVSVLVIIVRIVFVATKKRKNLKIRFFIWSDLMVAFLSLPLYTLCTMLPCAPIKSLANLIEVMALGMIWGVVLLVRAVLSFAAKQKYLIYARIGNSLIFILCILFALLFPTLSE